MRHLFVFAPIVMLCVAWLLGYARLTRAFVTYAVMLTMSVALVASAAFPVTEPSFGRFLLGFLCFLLAIPVALLVGLTGRKDPAPIAEAVKAYQGLTPEQQGTVKKCAGLAARFAAKHFGNHLRDRGYVRTAEAMQEGARFVKGV